MKKVVNRFLAGTVITGIGMSSVVMNVFGADLKLNPDVMKKAKAPDAHSLYSDIVSADEIFINFENKDFTWDEFYKSMEKYGLDLRKSGDEVSGGTYIGDFYVGVVWGDWTYDAYYEENRLIPHDSIWEIRWSGSVYDDETQTWISYSTADRDAIIECVEYINNGGQISVLKQKNGWSFEDGAWRFYENDMRTTGWRQIDGHWYYFKQDTSMVHSCFEIIEGNTYHFTPDGWLDTGWQFISRDGVSCWYYFDSDGKMVTGWKEIEGHWYYFQSDGTLTHSKLETMPDGKMYYFNTDGWMLRDTDITVEGIDYIIGSDGIVSKKIKEKFPPIDYRDAVKAYLIPQRGNADCGVASMATLEAYTSKNRDDMYEKVYQNNGNSVYCNWGNNGYNFSDVREMSDKYEMLYEYLQNGPCIIGNGAHFSIATAYIGDRDNISADGFIITDVGYWLNDSNRDYSLTQWEIQGGGNNEGSGFLYLIY